jgi:hypothetical protein
VVYAININGAPADTTNKDHRKIVKSVLIDVARRLSFLPKV